MKSLDIAEHMHVLSNRNLSLHQLLSMSEEEWRSLKLPVGPRVKLMNAVSNIARDNPVGQPEDTDCFDDTSSLSSKQVDHFFATQRAFY